MITINSLLKAFDDSNHLIITPHVINDLYLKKATSITSDQLMALLGGMYSSSIFDKASASFLDPILSNAFSQYSLNSSHTFIEKHYDKNMCNSFVEKFGLPAVLLLHNNAEIYVEKFLQQFCDKKVVVLDIERYCPLFQNFLMLIQEVTLLECVSTNDARPINRKSEREIATILAPVFICDALELICTKNSINVKRNKEQKISYSSAYQTINSFCNFHSNPSLQTIIPFMKMVLPLKLALNKNTFIQLCNEVYQIYLDSKYEATIDLPDAVNFIKDISRINGRDVSSVIHYLIYFTSLFDDFPKSRKRILEDYLLNSLALEIDIDLEGYDSIELISEIDVDWRFRHHVFIAQDNPLTAYPVIVSELTEINISGQPL